MSRATAFCALLLCGLSAKPATAQLRLECGLGVDLTLPVTLIRIDAPEALGLEPTSVKPETHYGYHFSFGTFPYEGWGWRAELGAGVATGGGTTDVGYDLIDRGLYGRAALDVQYVTSAWTSVGFGASLQIRDRGWNGATPLPYQLAILPTGIGLRGAWAKHYRWHTFALQLEAQTLGADLRQRTPAGDREKIGRYQQWSLSPSVRWSFAINRETWLRALERERVIYSPRL